MASKKSYIAVAAAVHEVMDSARGQTLPVVRLANRLADHFAADNPRFDRERFLEACGVQ